MRSPRASKPLVLPTSIRGWWDRIRGRLEPSPCPMAIPLASSKGLTVLPSALPERPVDPVERRELPVVELQDALPLALAHLIQLAV